MFVKSCALAGVCVAALTSSNVYAQTDDEVERAIEVFEIFVTTRKRVENLSEVPITISALTGATIARKGINSIADVANQTPGLSFDVGLIPSDTRISIRGLQAVRGRPNVAVLVDGIDTSSENFSVAGGGVFANLRLVDVERIEVVKGPQNVLYGRSAFAGAVNYITKRPGDELEAEASFNVASFATVEMRGAVGGPIIEDVLGVRVNGAYFRTSGDYNQTNTGDDLNRGESYGGAIGLLYTPTPSFTGYLRFQYGKEEYSERAQVFVGSVDPATGLPLAENGATLLPDLRPTAPFPALVYTIEGNLAETAAIRDQIMDRSGDPFNNNAQYEGTNIETWRVTLNLDWEGNFGTINSLTGFIHSESSINEDFDRVDFTTNGNVGIPGYAAGGPFSTLSLFQNMFGWPLPFLPAYSLSAEFESDVEIEQFSQSLRWSKDWGRVRTVVDALYWHEDAVYNDGSQFWLREGSNPLLGTFISFGQNPPPGGFGFHLAAPNETAAIPQRITRETDSYSIAASVEYEVSDTFTAIVEGRFIHDRIEYTGLDFDLFIVNTYGAAPGGLVRTDPPVVNDKFTPRISLAWDPMDDLLVFATYARGTKPGGVDTTDQNGDVNDGRFNPEKVDAFELGAKYVGLDGRLLLNGALFYNIYKDQQIGFVDTTGGVPQSSTVNIGKSVSKGIEGEMSWRPIEELFLRAAYTYTDAEFKDYVLPVCSATNSAETRTTNCSFDGNTPPQVAKHQLNLSGRYIYPVNDELNVSAEIDSRFLSKRYMSQTNQAFLPSFWQTDIRLSVETDQWSVIGYVENVFDNDTPRTGTANVDYSYFDLNAFLLPRAYLLALAPRREFGIRALFKF